MGRRIFNPTGKTKASRRYVPMSRRMFDMLLVRCAGKTEGWLFPCARAKGGHRTTVAKQFREARQKADLPASLVLYCARHAFGTAIYEETGNLAMVMKVMGHTGFRFLHRPRIAKVIPMRRPTPQHGVGTAQCSCAVFRWTQNVLASKAHRTISKTMQEK